MRTPIFQRRRSDIQSTALDAERAVPIRQPVALRLLGLPLLAIRAALVLVLAASVLLFAMLRALSQVGKDWA